ncbi:amidohydrolase family protein [Labrys wisconsinensis]|uniref:5-methylthioadenosine/S-adenosylhomocysteine deaminase n=1 Tax=Labrys wisconsinensis TaxID=425677 RepID=A0ABU0JBI5_9HYPH|nr:amidohydrolase family protein [Labrys wisconsinensis]MDQ0470773.1 5-methylthioadenosine/S-adenosylhomocysteine deaminase [Labrys wisconsinensis]
MRTFIGGGYLIAMSGKGPEVVSDSAIVLDGSRIAAVGTTADLAPHKATADRVIDARGRAILPGFVNTHTHLAGALTKALTEDVPTFGGPFRIALGMHENIITFEDVYLPGLVHGIEMLKTGTTTINECWWHQPQSARIIEAVGLRGIVAAEIREVDSSKIGFGRFERTWDQRLVEEGIDQAIDLLENWHGKADGRITCRVAPDGPDRLRPETMGRLGDLARKYGVGLHTHLCAVPGENEFMLKLWGKKSIPLLQDLGMLGPGFIGAHCVYMDDEDIGLMVDTGSCMSHTAFLVGKRGYYPPMQKVYQSGMKVSLGSDWLSNDMFNVMRSAIVIARVLYGEVGVRLAADVLSMATLDGARCLGLEAEVGSLEPGKKADVILLDVSTAWANPLRPENLVTNIVYNACGRDVTHVFVDGECLVDDQRLTRMDEAEVIREAQHVAEDVWQRAQPLFAAEGMA